MKLVQVSGYLLLVDEKAAMKQDDLCVVDGGLGRIGIDTFYDSVTYSVQPLKIEGHFAMEEGLESLDLPVLPNPFETDISEKEYLKELELSVQDKTHPGYGKGLSGVAKNIWKVIFNKGYKAAQSKQFSLEDIEKVVKLTLQDAKESVIWSEEYYKHLSKKLIKSLSTQQLPKEFIPKYEDEIALDGHTVIGVRIKEIINSEGKQEIVGTYKY